MYADAKKIGENVTGTEATRRTRHRHSLDFNALTPQQQWAIYEKSFLQPRKARAPRVHGDNGRYTTPRKAKRELCRVRPIAAGCCDVPHDSVDVPDDPDMPALIDWPDDPTFSDTDTDDDIPCKGRKGKVTTPIDVCKRAGRQDNFVNQKKLASVGRNLLEYFTKDSIADMPIHLKGSQNIVG